MIFKCNEVTLITKILKHLKQNSELAVNLLYFRLDKYDTMINYVYMLLETYLHMYMH